MRILHLVSRSQRRGAEMVALELAAELDVLGHHNRVLALALALDGGEDAELPALAKTSDLRPPTRALSSWRLRRTLAREPADVVLAHGGTAAQVAAVGLADGGPALVWQRILGFADRLWKPPRRHMWQLMARRVDGVVALTAEDVDEMRRLGYNGPAWVLGNFRRPDRFMEIDRAVEAKRLRQEIGLGADVPLIGFVGHLVDQKRPDRALDVLVGVHERGQDAHLVIAGNGPLRPMIESKVRALGLDDRVTMLGHRTDVEHVFGGIDLFILTSDMEGIPGVAIEATMSGCPVLTFPLGGVRYVVEHGVTGVVLDRLDVERMADEAVGLLRDVTRRNEMCEQARARTQEFSTSRRAAEYADRLAECHAARVGSPRSRRVAIHVSEKAGSRSRCPNLFVIGAPRAGTTYTYHALRRGQGIYMSPVKEPGFFTSDRAYALGLEHYLDAYFAKASGHVLRGEATPWYLYSEQARKRIADLPSDGPPKLVAVLRRPSARAWSMYRDQVRIGLEQRSFEAAVEQELAGLDRGELHPDVRKRYLWCGMYREHVEAWRAMFGRENLRVFVFEEMMRDQPAMWEALGQFLRVDIGPPPFEQLNDADRNPTGDLRWPRVDRFLRSFEGRGNPIVEGTKRVLPPGLHRRALQQFSRINRDVKHSPEIAPPAALIAELDAFFEAENERLRVAMEWDTSPWSNDSGSARNRVSG